MRAPNTDRDCNSYIYPNAYGNADSNGGTVSYSYSYGDSNGSAYAYRHAEAYTPTTASPDTTPPSDAVERNYLTSR